MDDPLSSLNLEFLRVETSGNQLGGVYFSPQVFKKDAPWQYWANCDMGPTTTPVHSTCGCGSLPDQEVCHFSSHHHPTCQHSWMVLLVPLNSLHLRESTLPPLKSLTNWSLVVRHCLLATPCCDISCSPLTCSSRSLTTLALPSLYESLWSQVNWMMPPLLLTDPSAMGHNNVNDKVFPLLFHMHDAHTLQSPHTTPHPPTQCTLVGSCGMVTKLLCTHNQLPTPLGL